MNSIDPRSLTEIYLQNRYREAMTFEDFQTIASYASGSVDTLFAWLRPIGNRSLRDTGIEAALNSWHGPADYAPGSRFLVGDAMGANPTAHRGGRLQRHRGDVEIGQDGQDVPLWWNHDGSQVLGRLAGYERNLNGPGSLRVWLELGVGTEADQVLTESDYGRIGMSVGLFAHKRDDGGVSLVYERQRLREISLCPLDQAALGPATIVRRVAVPPGVATAYANEHAAVLARSVAVAAGMQYRSFEGAHLTVH